MWVDGESGRGERRRGVWYTVGAGGGEEGMGRKGACKTVTWKAVAGLLERQAGREGFAGQDMAGWEPKRAVKSAMENGPRASSSSSKLDW